MMETTGGPSEIDSGLLKKHQIKNFSTIEQPNSVKL